MTKKAFMRQLRFALRGGLRRAVRTNILADCDISSPKGKPSICMKPTLQRN